MRPNLIKDVSVAQLYDEIWSTSKDHRSVIFRNATDLWVEVSGHHAVSRAQETNETKLLPPRAEYKWNFLGDSLSYSDTPAIRDLLCLLPDPYDFALQGATALTWTARIPQEEGAADKTPSGWSSEQNKLIELNDRRFLLKIGGHKSLSLAQLPRLGPMESVEVILSQQEASSMYSLCTSKILQLAVRHLEGHSTAEGGQQQQQQQEEFILNRLELPKVVQASMQSQLDNILSKQRSFT